MLNANYERIARALAAIENCQKTGNRVWEDKHAATIKEIVRDDFPSGSGFDTGTKFDFDASTPERLVFKADFHHMDEQGGYDGWSEHQVVVTPSLGYKFVLRITGRDRNDIKSYIAEVFANALEREHGD